MIFKAIHLTCMKSKIKLNFLTKVCMNALLIMSLISFNSLNKISKDSSFSKSNSIKVYSKEKFDVLSNLDIVYAQGLSHETLNSSNYSTLDLKLDLYYPDNKEANRPLYFFIHGGGFKEGSKSQKIFVKLAHFYASRGWVFVSIDYRLNKDLGTIPKAWVDYAEKTNLSTKIKHINAIYPAVRDAKAALRWVVKNAELYQINKDHITVGGGSAGAMIAVALGTSEPEDFSTEISVDKDYTLKTTNIGVPYEVKTIVSHWGSKLPIDVFENVYGHQRIDKNDPPLLMIHGLNDQIVDVSKPQELAELYKTLDIPHELYIIDKNGHALWNATINNNKLEELVLNFIVEQQNLVLNKS